MNTAILTLLFCFIAVCTIANCSPYGPEDFLRAGYREKPSVFRNEQLFVKDKETIVHRLPVEKARHLLELREIFEQNKNENPLYAKYHKIKLDTQEALKEQSVGAYPLPSDFWHFIPTWVGSVVPGKPPIFWDAPCFAENSAVAEQDKNGDFKLYIDAKNKNHLFCDDGYWIADVKNFHIEFFEFDGNHTISFNGPWEDDEKADIMTNGFRIWKFNETLTSTIVDIWETVDLFFGALLFGSAVPNWTAEDNLKFLKEYANITMEPRSGGLVDIPLNYIQSGDFLGVLRLDGLDPMLAWGMGSRTGHTTITMWHPDGNLYVHESTTNSKYWPTNGIQVTPWDRWVEQAMAADYNVVHLPLNDEARANFNVTAALEFFDTVQGLPYGFHNMLFCWIDTAEDNYPPPIDANLVMVLMSIVNEITPTNHTTDIFGQALNHRLGTKGLSVAECYYEAESRGMNFTELVTIPEQDEWIYENDNSTGRSMVCDVFVTSMWKAGGIFGNLTDLIQATEFTNFDAYTLAIFNDTASARPQVCADADPELPYCQLMGRYRMDMVKWNTMKPYPYMREHCPTLPPDYDQPPYC